MSNLMTHQISCRDFPSEIPFPEKLSGYEISGKPTHLYFINE
ncbi:MAG: hypothetical protein SGI89_15135 [bacterium]|nr:hypothetical protein [bacterium]